MFADESLLYIDNEILGGANNEWRVKRVRKLEYIFSQEWFRDKKVLELGCAFGNIGLYFKNLGAEVTFSDARQEALDVVRRKDSSVELLLLNQEKHWSLNRKFDLILHFGLLYNLDNWERDLCCTIHHAKYVALETAVARFSDKFECKIVNPCYPCYIWGPFSGVGTLVSSSNIENVFNKLQADYHRYDDRDLNLNDNWDEFCYDWSEEDDPVARLIIAKFAREPEKPVVNDWVCPYLGGRRFWIIRNNDAV